MLCSIDTHGSSQASVNRRFTTHFVASRELAGRVALHEPGGLVLMGVGLITIALFLSWGSRRRSKSVSQHDLRTMGHEYRQEIVASRYALDANANIQNSETRTA
jgi:hypothetical protein